MGSCGGICSDEFIARLLLNVLAKELLRKPGREYHSDEHL